MRALGSRFSWLKDCDSTGSLRLKCGGCDPPVPPSYTTGIRVIPDPGRSLPANMKMHVDIHRLITHNWKEKNDRNYQSNFYYFNLITLCFEPWMIAPMGFKPEWIIASPVTMFSCLPVLSLSHIYRISPFCSSPKRSPWANTFFIWNMNYPDSMFFDKIKTLFP